MKRVPPFAAALFVTALAALASPHTSIALQPSLGGEPVVTNTPTNSQFFDWTSDSQTIQYCVTVYRNGTSHNRGCTGVLANNGSPASGRLSQTENALPDGTLVSTYPLRYFWDGSGWIPYPCSGPNCSSSTLIDLNKPVLTVSASGTATYTNNPQIPMHIEYSDALSHPWMAGGNNAAVFVCQRRDRACTNADPHNYTPVCSVANFSRFAAPGNSKQNSFDCMYDFTSQPDGPVYLCASAADQSIPDPDPTANESQSIYPTHVNQFIKPSTGVGWTASDANLSNSSCGSVLLDRAPPTISAQASNTSPGPGDLVTFSASGSDGASGIVGPFTWDFGDNTQSKEGTNLTHTYSNPGTYNVVLSGQDGAGNAGTGSVTINVTAPGGGTGGGGNGGGGTGGGGTVVDNPPSKTVIGGGEGTQQKSLGSLKVIAPKKLKLGKKGKKPKPLLLALIASKPGAFQAALTKGPKVVSKGAGVLGKAGTFGFKLKLPKQTTPGICKLRVTYLPDGDKSGTTKTIGIKFYRPRTRGRASQRALAGSGGPVNVDTGPPLAAGYSG